MTDPAMMMTTPWTLPEEGSPDAEFWLRDDRLAELGSILPEIRILSLDVFDTLLFRICRDPHDVFLATGRRAIDLGILRGGLTAEEYRAARIYALDTAYRASPEEPTLDDILALLPADLGDRARLAQLEIETEEDHCYLNPSILSLIRHCRARNIRIALVSDMYLGRLRVLQLLRRSGFTPDRADQVLVSVDEGAMKASGLLFRRLLDMNPDVKPGEILHIGDNPSSDVEAARREGIRAIHYDVVRADPAGILAYEETRYGGVLPELHALRGLAMMSAGPRCRDEDRPWYRMAAGVLAPFLCALCEWVVDTACEEGAEVIAPFMREAVTLAPMLERTIAQRGLHLPVRPLFVSREAVVLAGRQSMDEQVARSLFENREYFRVQDLFRSLELGDSMGRFEPHRETYLGQAWSIRFGPGRTLLEELSGFLMESGTRAQIEATIHRRRRALVAYLSGVFGGARRIVTLDLGFLGQIQKGLDSALKLEGRDIHLTHLMGFGKGNSGELLVQGMDVRAFAGSAGLHLDLIDTIHRSAPVLEQMLMGREGTTTGYTALSGDGVEPVLESNPMEEWEFARKDVLRFAIQQFQDLWFYFRREKPRAAARIQQEKLGWCRLIHRLIDVPTAEEARIIGDLHNDCNFGSTRVVPLCPMQEEQRIREVGADDYHRFVRHRSTAVWPQGCITRVDAGAILSHFALKLDSGYFERMLDFSRRLVGEGIGEIIICGVGDVGRSLIRAARLSGLKVICAADRNQGLWGSRFDGVEITSLEDAIARGVHDYAIASFAFTDEIRRSILARYRDRAMAPRIFCAGENERSAVGAESR